jgi:hypothetical protein
MDTQAYANGTQLYLSGTTAGTYTSTKPQAPIHLVYVAIVVRSHPTQGVLEVKIQNGEELSELHDVQVISIANNNILQYSSADSLWHNVAGTTTNIAEGTNLYYTDTRARASISTTATGLTYTSGTGVLSLTAGYVIPTTTSATEWDTAYTNRITSATSPLSITSNVISIAQATTSTNGYLSSTDWTTFNNKQATLSLTTTGSSGAATLVSNTLNIPTYTLTGLGGVPTTRTLTINGTGYDLSADRSWTIPTSVNATFTQDYTATAAQTTFTVTGGYTVGQLAVYYNGSKLASAEFTATNGTTFVLATACQVNDIVQAVVEITGGGIGGSGTTNYVSKFTASGVLGNSLIFDNGTNVGIGNTNTTYKLDVSGTGRFTSSVTSGSNGFNALGAYGFTSYEGAAASGKSINFSLAFFNSIDAIYQSSGNTNDFGIWTNGGTSSQPKLYIKNAGNVGIGQSTPSSILHIKQSTNAQGLFIESHLNDTQFRFAIVGTTESRITSTYTSTGSYLPITFFTSDVERMRILADNTVCFGKTVYDNSTTGVSIADTKTTAIVSVVTDAGVSILCNRKTSTGDIIVFRYNGSGVGSISTNGSTTSYNITSDYRLKEDLKEINGLQKVSAIKVYDFKWKNSNNRMDGVIAHELAEVLPYAIEGEKDAVDENGNIKAQGVDYSKIVPILVKAIQELKAEIDELKNK